MSRLAITIAAVAFLGACSGHGGETTDSAGESLGITVHHPVALGGGDHVTHFAPHTAPVRVYPVGLPLVHRAPVKHGGDIKVMSATSLPASIDISANAPSPGDQGQTGSCAAWATGYSSMGWWASKTGMSGAPFAPMFLYAQEVQGACDQGTSIEGNMDILQQTGIDTAADYQPMQDNLDCATQPTSAQIANAANYKITGYTQLDLSDPRTAIESELAAGHPVVLGILAYPELMNANASNYLVGPPHAGDTLYGGHAIAAFKYDDNGVWILNSWSSQWGRNGWAELSWSFITGSLNGRANLMDAAAIGGVVGGNAPPPPQPPPPSSGPQVSFASPAAGTTVSPGASVSIVVDASDAVAISTASLDWQSPSGHSTFALSSMGNGQWGATLTLSSAAVHGTRTLTVTVTDANSQQASVAETINVQ